MKLFILPFVLLLSPLVGRADDDINSGSELLKNCNAYMMVTDGSSNSKIILGAGRCLGIVRGIMDAGAIFDTFAEKAGKTPPNVFCLPENVSTDQGIRVVVKYLEEHPADLHQRGTALTVRALKQAFPCK